jgi:hypothetical protein
VASIARKPLEKAPLPIAFGGPGAVTDRGPRALAGPPVPAAAVHEQPDHDLPVQLLHDMVPEPGERLAAVRAAVPAALEVPGHLDLRQVAVVTPPGPGPRPPLPPPSPSRGFPPWPPPPGGAACGRVLSDDRPNATAAGPPGQHAPAQAPRPAPRAPPPDGSAAHLPPARQPAPRGAAPLRHPPPLPRQHFWILDAGIVRFTRRAGELASARR